MQHQQSQSEPIAIAEASTPASASISGNSSPGLEREQAEHHEDQLFAGQLAIDGTATVLQTAEVMPPTSRISAKELVFGADMTPTRTGAAKLSLRHQDASSAGASEDPDSIFFSSHTDDAAHAVLGSVSTALHSPPQAAARKPFAYGVKGAVFQLQMYM